MTSISFIPFPTKRLALGVLLTFLVCQIDRAEPQSRWVKTIDFSGLQYLTFDLSTLEAEFLRPAPKEELQFYFLSMNPNAMLWKHEGRDRTMYLLLRNGRLVFVNDNGSGRPEEVVYRFGARYDDQEYHLVKLVKEGRKIQINVDNARPQTYMFTEDVQLVEPARIYMGGIPEIITTADGQATHNLRGSLALIKYETQFFRGSVRHTNMINLISRIDETEYDVRVIDWRRRNEYWPPTHRVTVPTAPTRTTSRTQPTRPTTPTTTTRRPTTRPPLPPLTSITIINDRVTIPVDERFSLRHGSSISFKFKTIKKNGLLMFSTSNLYGRNYIALQIYDGLLYFIHNFGGKSVRTLLSETIVSDGQEHDVDIKFYRDRVVARLDGGITTIGLQPGDQLPRNLGQLIIGAYRTPEVLPWHTWARVGYEGCLSDVSINGQRVDFRKYMRDPSIAPGLQRRCSAMPRQCSTLDPCRNGGDCINTWGGYYCDCRGTDYTCRNCESLSWVSVFNGTTYYSTTFRPEQRYHVENISFRFKTMVPDGLIFHARGTSDDGFLRVELEGGRIKISTNLGDNYEQFYVGENLNDMQWHTVYIQRRGDQVEFWVDNEAHKKEYLVGENFFHRVSEILIGGYSDQIQAYPGDVTWFRGYLRNFYFGNNDIINILNVNGKGPFYKEPNLPHIVFYDVTFPNYETFIELPALGSTSDLNIQFMFRTNDQNGIILFNQSPTRETFVVELFNGVLHVKFQVPGKAPLESATPAVINYSDGKWHMVHITQTREKGQNYLRLNVDGMISNHAYSGIDSINLSGPLYIGGVPKQILEQEHIRKMVSSSNGYRGCMASLTLGRGGIPNLYQKGQDQGVRIIQNCQDIVSNCQEISCANGGICYDFPNNSSTWCDCSMTGYAGAVCRDYPMGYYFYPETEHGVIIYKYPSQQVADHERIEIVLGVMTEEENGMLAKLVSENWDDTIELKLVNGYVVASFDTLGNKVLQSITNGNIKVNDGRYHIIRFVHTKDNSTLTVDGNVDISRHVGLQGKFDSLYRIFIGGVSQGDAVVKGSGLRGIIGGVYINGKLVFREVERGVNNVIIGEVIPAPNPFRLWDLPTVVTDWTTIPPTPPTVLPPIVRVVPPEYGGGGVAWAVGGGGGINVWTYPGGSGGVGVGIPVPPPSGGIGEPVTAAQVAVIPSLPASGPRAGAVMGTLLGLMMFASSLMWAFYKCKPGWCTCLKPPAAVPLNISAPKSGSNMGAVQAASGAGVTTGGAGAGGAGVGGAGGVGSGAGAGADLDEPDAPGPQTQLLSSPSAGAGGGYHHHQAGAMASSGHQRVESYDSATLRAMGTFSNKGTALGTPRAERAAFGSSSGYTVTEHTTTSNVLQPASSLHFEGNNMADYDVATGVHSNYQSNTLQAGGAGAGHGGGFSTSTMSSNYNYSVKTIKTVGGQQAMMGYAGSSSNVIVTPGAMGEEVRVDCCLMTSDGHSVVTGSSLGPPQVWTMANGELLRIMQGETVGSTYLHLMSNDRLLVGAINADLEINQYSVPKGVHNYVFQTWDFTTGRPLDMPQTEICSALCTMSDNDKVVFARSDNFGGGTNIIVWDLLGNRALKEMRYDAPVGNNDYVSYINISQNDRYVIAGYNNTFDNFAEFVIFDMSLTSYVSDPNILRLDAVPECTAVLPRDEAVTGLRNGDLVVWSLRTGQPSRQLLANNGKHAHSREVKAVARSKDNKYLVSASADGTLKLWDLQTENHICTMSGHSDEVWCTAISDDNEIIVSGSRDGTIRLWRLKTGQEICAFNAGVDVFYITMSKDKGTIVALGDKYGARKLIMLQVVRSKIKRQVLA